MKCQNICSNLLICSKIIAVFYSGSLCIVEERVHSVAVADRLIAESKTCLPLTDGLSFSPRLELCTLETFTGEATCQTPQGLLTLFLFNVLSASSSIIYIVNFIYTHLLITHLTNSQKSAFVQLVPDCKIKYCFPCHNNEKIGDTTDMNKLPDTPNNTLVNGL